MVFDESGFLYDPCWDCPYWKGYCSPNGELCPEEVDHEFD